MYQILEDVVLPIFVCALMPVAIVWIIYRFRGKRIERKASLISEAMAKGTVFDAQAILGSDSKRNEFNGRSYKNRVLSYLKRGACLLGLGIGCAFAAYLNASTFFYVAGTALGLLGIALLVVYLISRKTYSAEIEAEEKKNVEKILSAESK